MLPFVLLLATFWGAAWAAYLQYNEFGHFLATRRTWITVVIGVGVDLLLIMTLVNVEAWLQMAGVIAASSLGIIIRSIYNELRDEQAAREVNNDE